MNQKENIEFWKQEIRDTEKAFSDMALEKGVDIAFLDFAADDAVLLRSEQLIMGKDSIKAHFDQQKKNNSQLTWSPDFIEVSQLGDLGYTYGHYIFTSIDTSGTKTERTGIFHTVWKRQADGKWKFVWD